MEIGCGRRQMKRKMKLLSASSRKSHKLQSNQRAATKDDYVSLQDSPINKHESNDMSKQSFYSRCQFERYSEEDENVVEQVKRKSQLKTFDNLPAQMSRNEKKQNT